MSFDPKKFNFSSTELKLSAGNFEAFLRERYGKKYKLKELKQVVKLYHSDEVDILEVD